MLLSSGEMKTLMKIGDCELMHLRESGELPFKKVGRSFFYSIPDGKSLLQLPLGQQLLFWYRQKHDIEIDNTPKEAASEKYLEILVGEILLPVEREFGQLSVTYGFTSAKLTRHIKKYSPAGTAPSIDQHACSEKNSAGNMICSRQGAACDFIIPDVSMADVTRFICSKLNYDRIYFYGKFRPLHVSVNTSLSKHLQVMSESSSGRRYPSKRALGDKASLLALEL